MCLWGLRFHSLSGILSQCCTTLSVKDSPFKPCCTVPDAFSLLACKRPSACSLEDLLFSFFMPSFAPFHTSCQGSAFQTSAMVASFCCSQAASSCCFCQAPASSDSVVVAGRWFLLVNADIHLLFLPLSPFPYSCGVWITLENQQCTSTKLPGRAWHLLLIKAHSRHI